MSWCLFSRPEAPGAPNRIRLRVLSRLRAGRERIRRTWTSCRASTSVCSLTAIPPGVTSNWIGSNPLCVAAEASRTTSRWMGLLSAGDSGGGPARLRTAPGFGRPSYLQACGRRPQPMWVPGEYSFHRGDVVATGRRTPPPAAHQPQLAPRWIAPDGRSLWRVWTDFQAYCSRSRPREAGPEELQGIPVDSTAYSRASP
jgi:hypothetical protein